MSSITYGRPGRSLPDIIQLPIKSSHCHTLTYGIHLGLGLSVRFRLYSYRDSLIDLTKVYIIREISDTIVTLRYSKIMQDQQQHILIAEWLMLPVFHKITVDVKIFRAFYSSRYRVYRWPRLKSILGTKSCSRILSDVPSISDVVIIVN